MVLRLRNPCACGARRPGTSLIAPRVPMMAARATAIIPRAPRDDTTTAVVARASAPRASPYGAAPSFPAASSTPRASGVASASSTEPTVEELMDPNAPVLREDTPLRDAARLFLQSNTQSAPVVDSSGALVGVLSESDLILKSSAVPEDHWLLPPVYIGVLDATLSLRDEAAWRGEVEKILARDVGHAMTRGGGKAGKGGGKAEKILARDVGHAMTRGGGKAGKGGGKAASGKGQQALITAAPHEAVGVAAGRMAHHRVNMLPVVDGEGRVVGTLTRHDVLRGLYATQNPLL